MLPRNTAITGRPSGRLVCYPEVQPVDARALAASWRRPYSSVQWAWVRALDVQPSDSWGGGKLTKRQRHASREMREAMAQRHGVRGL